jgi:preprotein translocase subunit SecB
MAIETNSASETTPTTESSLAVQRIYTKGSLFEAVAFLPELLKTASHPVIDLQAQANFSERGEDAFEAVLTLQLTAKADGNLLWRIQLQQAGLYALKGFDEEQRKHILSGYCMNQLYPYAAATASSMVVQGGFPPAYLAPMNFEALYREQQKKEKEAAAKAPVEIAH